MLPPPRKATSRGGDSRSLVGLAIVDGYVKLCRNPAGDIMRWLAEFDGPPGADRLARPTTRGDKHEHTTAFRQPGSDLADTRGLRRHALHHVRDGLDAHRTRRGADRLSARSAASAGRYEGLRSLQAGERGNLVLRGGVSAECSIDFGGAISAELAAVSSHYAARMAAVRRSARPGDVAYLLRALADDQVLAKREVIGRMRAARRVYEERSRLPSPEMRR